ncbi:hypothetical protein HAX54_050524, partial [Datura stramonium]|nr:hypothetical protein [Datura stramonium]
LCSGRETQHLLSASMKGMLNLTCFNLSMYFLIWASMVFFINHYGNGGLVFGIRGNGLETFTTSFSSFSFSI